MRIFDFGFLSYIRLGVDKMRVIICLLPISSRDMSHPRRTRCPRSISSCLRGIWNIPFQSFAKNSFSKIVFTRMYKNNGKNIFAFLPLFMILFGIKNLF